MSQSNMSKPLPPNPPTTTNPMVALGRKVKSALGTDQKSSVRIVRATRQTPSSQDFAKRPEPMQESIPAKPDTYANRFKSLFARREHQTGNEKLPHSDSEDDNDMVDLLDVMDPEVATLSTLTNVQNSLFVPSLGKLVNRRPTYRISESPRDARMVDKLKVLLKNIKTSSKDKVAPTNFEFAIVPDDEKLEGWSNSEKEELDDAVRHQLHSTRAKFKRSMKGFRQYIRRPFGLFITVYATLITLFGAAWVFFLIGWISLGSKQSYVINIVDNVLVALFAIIGDGLAPFRAVDTYHMCYIAYYHRQTWKQRQNLGLPDLQDRNDLPENQQEEAHVDLESQVAKRMPRNLARRVAPHIPKRYAEKILSRSRAKDPGAYEYSVLTPEQQAKLEYHERKFSKSHTFYKPHETETHFAFPLKLLVAVVLLLDLHSCLQITLGACTWGINYKTRPFALTTVILCFSITCNITGGYLISRGDKLTRKREVVERMMRQELTAEVIGEIHDRKVREAEERGEISPEVRRLREEKAAKKAKEDEEVKKSWKSVAILPKTLLGKGVDHRQPSLPKEMRGSGSNVGLDGLGGSKSSLSVDKKKKKTPTGLESVGEEVRKPEKVKRKELGSGSGSRTGLIPLQAQETQSQPQQGKGQKVLGFFRKADLDRS